MRTKITFGILVILIIAISIGVSMTKNKSKEYDEKIINLNSEISQLQEKETECNNLIERKNQLITNTKSEILNSKKGSTLTDLGEEKTQLINEINNL